MLDGRPVLYATLVYLPYGGQTKANGGIQGVAQAVCLDGASAVVGDHYASDVYNDRIGSHHALPVAGFS